LHRLHFRDANAFLQFSHVSKQGNRIGFPAGAVDPRDTEPGRPPVAVLSYPYWQTHWGADPQVVGRVIRVNNQLVEIAGVAPYDFDGLSPRRTDIWLPVSIRPLILIGSPPPQQDFSRPSQALFGKPKPGVSQAAAEAELTVLTRGLAHTRRAFEDTETIQGQYVQAALAKLFRQSPAIAIFIIIVLLVLLSACANLGNMLLARGLAREREIYIRASIGASRARLIRQLMTENFLLAILGSIAGLLFGELAARILLRALGVSQVLLLTLSWQIIVGGFVLTILSAIAFGLPSALKTVRSSSRNLRLRQSLVAVQVAVSCLLLIASSILAHNGIANASVDLAFDYQNMIVIYPQLYTANLTPAVAQQELDNLSARLSALPGITAAAAAVAPPLGSRVLIENAPGKPRVFLNIVEPSYFPVMSLPVLRGRAFIHGEPNTAIVSESAARALWPNEDPIGKTWALQNVDRTVIGVVKDSGVNLLADADSIEAYLPLTGRNIAGAALILHARSDPASLVRMIPAAAANAKGAVTVTLMRASHDNFLDGQRRLVALFGSIGALATGLAAAGMFALVAFAVAQRKRELGVRMAIGAARRHILSVLLLQNLKPTALGIIGGAILAAILARLVNSQIALQHHNTVDVIAFSAGIALFIVVAVLATLSPALRALRIDPSATLREE